MQPWTLNYFSVMFSFLFIQNILGNNEKGDIFVFIILSEQYFSRFLNGNLVVDWEQLGRWIISNWMISGGSGNTLQFVVFIVKVGMVLIFRVRDAITIVIVVFVVGLAIVIIVSIICMEKMASIQGLKYLVKSLHAIVNKVENQEWRAAQWALNLYEVAFAQVEASHLLFVLEEKLKNLKRLLFQKRRQKKTI